MRKNRECYPEPCENPHVVDTTGMDLGRESEFKLTRKQKLVLGSAGAGIAALGFFGCSNAEADRQPTEIENVEGNNGQEQGGEQESTLEWWEEPYDRSCAADANEIRAGMINRERLNDRELSLLDAPISSMVGEDRAAFMYTMSNIYRRWINAPEDWRFERANSVPFKMLNTLDENTSEEDIAAKLRMFSYGLWEIAYTGTTVPNRELMAKIRIAAYQADPTSDAANRTHANAMSSIPPNNRLTIQMGEISVSDLVFDEETGAATFNVSRLDPDGTKTEQELEAHEHEFTCPRTGERKTIVLFNALSLATPVE